MCKPNFFAVNRSVRNHDLVGYFVDDKPNPFFPVWIYMLHHAAFQDRVYVLKGLTYNLARGQLVLSELDICKMWGLQRKKVRVWLTKLGASNMIKRGQQKGRVMAIITVCNYDAFQPAVTIEGPAQGPAKLQNGANHTKKEVNKVKNKREVKRPSNDPQLDIEDAVRAAEAAEAAAAAAAATPVAPVEVEQPKMGPTAKARVALDLWNALAAECGLPKAQSMGEDRTSRLNARLQEHGEESWAKALGEVKRSKFLRGKTKARDGRPFMADIDFLLQPSSYVKVLEGKYTRLPADCIEGVKAGPYAPGAVVEAKAQPTYEEVAVLAKAARERRHQQQLERQRDQELAWANAVLADPQMSPYVPNALDDIEANVAKAKSIVVQHCLT